MSKQVLFLLLFAAVIGIMPSCQKDPKPQDEGKKDEKPMTPREREIYNMLESAGTLSNEVPTGYGKTAKTLRVDSVPAVQDGKSGMRFTETKHCAFGESDGEFTLLSPWAGILWPGALIQGGSLRGKAVPSSIPLYRKRKQVASFSRWWEAMGSWAMRNGTRSVLCARAMWYRRRMS